MRWIWRIFVVFVLFLLINNIFSANEPQAFISKGESSRIYQTLKWKINQLRDYAQDLPASVEVQIRRFLSDFKPNNNGRPV